MPSVAELRVYPVKSLRGRAVARAQVEPWGLAGDRRWMVITPDGRFITQRAHPVMATIVAAVGPAGLTLSQPGRRPLMVPFPEARPETVTIWRDQVPAVPAGPEADAWLSDVIGIPCRLVHQADPMSRPVDPAFSAPGDHVTFADGFPLLITTLGSLADLEARLGRPLGMDRFRANVVVADTAAWDEDHWRVIRIGEVTFRATKPCGRCVMTTIDQETGIKAQDGEPLRFLSGFRRDEAGRIVFGQNLIPDGPGRIAQGDAVEVLERA